MRHRLRFVIAAAAASALLLAVMLGAPPSASSAPWDLACTGALTGVADAASSLQTAQHEVQERYQRFEEHVKGYDACRTFPEVYDVLRDRCERKRSVTEAARSEAEKSLSAFNARIRALYDALNGITPSCGSQRGAKDAPPPGQAR
jgi:hypothetical protein